jgi:hypothetical protein
MLEGVTAAVSPSKHKHKRKRTYMCMHCGRKSQTRKKGSMCVTGVFVEVGSSAA